MIARTLLVIPFVIAGLWLSANPALACSCHRYTPSEIAAVSEVVFTGVPRAYVGTKLYDTIVEFEVRTVYKGPLVPRLQVQAIGGHGPSGGLGPGCEYGFALGRQYTVFATDHDTDGTPNTSGCSQNVEGPINAATYGLAAGQSPARGDEALPLSIVAAFAIVALAVMTIARRPRRLVP